MIPANHSIKSYHMFQRLIRHKLAAISAVVLIGLALLSCFAPLIESVLEVDHTNVDLYNRFASPSFTNLLGTDELGRDLFVRLLYGGRVSLSIAITAAIIASVFGTLVGLTAGYYGGWLDRFLMRFNDAFMALPLLPLLIVLAAVDLEKVGVPKSIAESDDISLYRIVIIISMVSWNTVARLVRAETLALRESDFTRAAQSLGASSSTIIVRHILPNSSSPIIVATTLSVGYIILFESVLSFLGLGVQAPLTSWGHMLSNAQELIWSAPYLAILPGLMIFITVIACNFFGDGLQDAMDPRAA